MLRLTGGAGPQAVALGRAITRQVAQRPSRIAQRAFADANSKPSIQSSTPPILPGSASSAAKDVPPPPALKTAFPSTPETQPTQVPLTPSPSSRTSTASSASPPSSSPPTPADSPVPPPPPPPPPKKRHRVRNFLIFITLLTGSGFGLGTWYSLRNDNFHDFFTEFIPFGEDAVLFFEEREFRRRFPQAHIRQSQHTPQSRQAEHKMIHQKSGATWRLSGPEEKKNGVDLSNGDGPFINAANSGDKRVAQENIKPAEAKVVEIKDAPKRDLSKQKSPGTKAEVAKKPVEEQSATPLTDSKSKLAPATTPAKSHLPLAANISKLDLSDTNDPIVKDLIGIVNTVIDHINETEVAAKVAPVIAEASTSVKNLNEKLSNMKETSQEEISAHIEKLDGEFQRLVKQLGEELDSQVKAVEARWREQYEQEREHLANSYKEKLEAELAAVKEASEARSKNELLEQAIEMKRRWIHEVKDRVETEREGRLGKIEELAKDVEELEKLTASWNAVVMENLKTQKLHVALEAVRAAVDNPKQPRPFVSELAALKETGNDDDVIRAAIASINPTAYQRGVYPNAQLIDRFRNVANEVRKASLLSEGAGVAGHAMSWLFSKVMFQKKGMHTDDNDVESILSRTEMFLEEGKLDDAAREMNQLNGWARVLATDWMKEVRVSLEVRQAMEVIAAQARLESLRMEGIQT